jgi:hypothetical protein
MLFPPDYHEQWGRRYGIGLGTTPVSEALVNDYHFTIAENKDPLLSMHPVSVCRAQVDLVDIPDGSPELDRIAVVAIDDPYMDKRANLMRERQRVHDAHMRRIYDDEMQFRLGVDNRQKVKSSTK